MCDPELIACENTCPCWAGDVPTERVGDHDGHCCFTKDDRATPAALEDWRTGDDECQPPQNVPSEVPC